jgi:hypothetical protein
VLAAHDQDIRVACLRLNIFDSLIVITAELLQYLAQVSTGVFFGLLFARSYCASGGRLSLAIEILRHYPLSWETLLWESNPSASLTLLDRPMHAILLTRILVTAHDMRGKASFIDQPTADIIKQVSLDD